MSTIKDEKATIPLFLEENGSDLSYIKIGFSRKLYGIIACHLVFISVVTAIVMFTPLARFYVNENEWLLQFFIVILLLSYIAVFFKKDAYNINIFLLIVHMLFQISTVAVFITYYDLLGVLQGIFLTLCGIFSLFSYLLLFRKSCELRMGLLFSFAIVLTTAASFQMVFGCTSEEFVTSTVLSVCLLLYYLYSVNLVIHTVPHDKFCIAVIHVNIWPLKTLASKINFLALK